MERLILAAVLIALLVGYGCGGGIIGSPPRNQPPETFFANVPPDSSEIPYRIVLYWYGNDPDGFVIGYEYAINDSIEEWTWVEATEDTVEFPAPNLSDLDSIWVRAVDNDSLRDPTPVMRYYTATTIAPETWIVSGHPHPEVYCLEQTTETWPGIIFCYGGMDPDGEVVGYETKVDAQVWSEVTEESYISIVNLTEGEHTFWVRSIDNAGAHDPSPANIPFTVVVPSFDREMLLIDESLNYLMGTPSWPDDAMVDSFYHNLLPPATGFRKGWVDFDFSGSFGPAPGSDTIPPTRAILGHYKLLIYHNDDPTWEDEQLGNIFELLEEYLDVGGNLLMVGFDNLSPLVQSFPAQFSPWEFPYEYLGIEEAAQNYADNPADFLGAHGQAPGYDDLEVDSIKATPLPQFQWWGKLKRINSLTPRSGTQVIYTFDSYRGDPEWEGKPCAVLYERGDSKIAFFGFPLYQIKVNAFVTDEPIVRMTRTLWEWYGL